MDREQVTQKFQQASRLYMEKKYTEALAILDEVNRAFPNNKDILYARGRCLARLGRLDEARIICDQLTTVFSDPRGEQLKAKIAAEQAAGAEWPNNFGETGGSPPQKHSKRVVVGIVATACLLGIAAFLFLRKDSGETRVIAPEGQPQQPTRLFEKPGRENASPEQESALPRKLRQLTGPINDALSARPQLVVYSINAEDPLWDEKIHDHLASEYGGSNVASEDDVSEEELSRGNLVLLLLPRSPLLQTVRERLPISLHPSEIRIGDRTFPRGSGDQQIYGVVFCCPNPFNPTLYATTLYAFDPQAFSWLRGGNRSVTDWFVFGRDSLWRGYFDKSDPSQWTVPSRDKALTEYGPQWRDMFLLQDDAVVDLESKLVWQRADSGKDFWLHEEARAYCEQLSLSGKKGWRLPSREELQDLYDRLSALPGSYRAEPFEWSGEIYRASYRADEDEHQALLDFRSGGWYYEGMTGLVRAVHDP